MFTQLTQLLSFAFPAGIERDKERPDGSDFAQVLARMEQDTQRARSGPLTDAGGKPSEGDMTQAEPDKAGTAASSEHREPEQNDVAGEATDAHAADADSESFEIMLVDDGLVSPRTGAETDLGLVGAPAGSAAVVDNPNSPEGQKGPLHPETTDHTPPVQDLRSLAGDSAALQARSAVATGSPAESDPSVVSAESATPGRTNPRATDALSPRSMPDRDLSDPDTRKAPGNMEFAARARIGEPEFLNTSLSDGKGNAASVTAARTAGGSPTAPLATPAPGFGRPSVWTSRDTIVTEGDRAEQAPQSARPPRMAAPALDAAPTANAFGLDRTGRLSRPPGVQDLRDEQPRQGNPVRRFGDSQAFDQARTPGAALSRLAGIDLLKPSGAAQSVTPAEPAETAVISRRSVIDTADSETTRATHDRAVSVVAGRVERVVATAPRTAGEGHRPSRVGSEQHVQTGGQIRPSEASGVVPVGRSHTIARDERTIRVPNAAASVGGAAAERPNSAPAPERTLAGAMSERAGQDAPTQLKTVRTPDAALLRGVSAQSPSGGRTQPVETGRPGPGATTGQPVFKHSSGREAPALPGTEPQTGLGAADGRVGLRPSGTVDPIAARAPSVLEAVSGPAVDTDAAAPAPPAQAQSKNPIGRAGFEQMRRGQVRPDAAPAITVERMRSDPAQERLAGAAAMPGAKEITAFIRPASTVTTAPMEGSSTPETVARPDPPGRAFGFERSNPAASEGASPPAGGQTSPGTKAETEPGAVAGPTPRDSAKIARNTTFAVSPTIDAPDRTETAVETETTATPIRSPRDVTESASPVLPGASKTAIHTLPSPPGVPPETPAPALSGPTATPVPQSTQNAVISAAQPEPPRDEALRNDRLETFRPRAAAEDRGPTADARKREVRDPESPTRPVAPQRNPTRLTLSEVAGLYRVNAPEIEEAGPTGRGDADQPLAQGEVRAGPAAPASSGTSIARAVTPQATIRQIADAMPRDAEGTFEIRLNPEELGRVRMTLAPTEAGLSVHIHADRPETLDLLRRNIDQLARDLAQGGNHAASFTFGGEGQQGGGQHKHASVPAADAVATETATHQTPGRPVAADGLDIRL